MSISRKSFLQFSAILLLPITQLNYSGCFAANASSYQNNSVLSQGRWAKVEVSETGLYFLSPAQLNALGFSNTSKVNIYGYGGGMIPENLDSPDDLPIVPSMSYEGGLIFFGSGAVKWKLNPTSLSTYSHISDPYSDHAYYFISDVADRHINPDTTTFIEATPNCPLVDHFIERIIHEQDLISAMKTGRLMLGEDFKVNSSKDFSFLLPGNIGDALLTTSFACKTSSGISSLVFNANGTQLGATNTDLMSASASKLVSSTQTVKTIDNPGEILNLSLKFNGSGNVDLANLDYIEIEYPKELRLEKGKLYFYINPVSLSRVEISDASSSCVVWDVTNPVSPKIVVAEYQDNSLSFVVSPGYSEYVVFNPSSISSEVILSGTIENQDIHALEAPDMLVICPDEYLPAAQKLVDLHASTDRLKVTVLTPQKIYNEFSSGKPDVSAFRKLLKMWFDRGGGNEGSFPAYCLIMSRPTYDNKMVTPLVRNAGYPRVPIWQSPDGDSPTSSYSTDDYIGMLEDVEGEFDIASAKINVAVARMPVKSLKEANEAIAKLEGYMKNSDFGAWRNNVLVIADDQDAGIHLSQAENCIKEMKSSSKGDDMLYHKLYLDSYKLEYTSTGAAYPQARKDLLDKFANGVLFIDYIGHASSKEWGHEHLLTWPDIESLDNSRLPFVYAATCEFMNWDSDDISGAEALWLNPSGGVIGMICPSREVLIAYNGDLNRASSSFFFSNNQEGKPHRVGDMMVKGKNNSATGTNKLRYGLIGDPSLTLLRASQNVRVDSIAGINVGDEPEEFPVVGARSSFNVSGSVRDVEDRLLADFNGMLEFTIYDAEKVITTNGNGDNGEEMVFNTRGVALFRGKTKVEGGKWNASVLMPSDISNNFSPALISLYSFSEEGVTANGNFENFYVHGYDASSSPDFEGPTILECYLNNPSFQNGQEVGWNPILKVSVRDESGICVSGSGIGHDLSLEIDGKRYYDDLGKYYEPDLTDASAGSLSYPLKDLDFGEHSLNFTVWDNAGNSSSRSLDFSISALWKPSIKVLATNASPAVNEVTFIIETDGQSEAKSCEIDVFDINGRHVWSAPISGNLSGLTHMTLDWNLNDFSGRRIPRGIYPYTAVITTGTGLTIRKSAKLAVTAP